MDEAKPENLDKVYAEASQWLRLVNTIIWAMGAIFVPASVGCVYLALKEHDNKWFCAVASICSLSAWLYISLLYRKTSKVARDVLMNVERTWNIPGDMALFTIQGQVGHSRYSQVRVQIGALAVLVVLWVYLLIVLQ